MLPCQMKLGKRCESLQCPTFYCFNGGTCRVTANLTTSSNNVFPLLSCICPKDFRGTRCQHILRRGDITSSQSNKKVVYFYLNLYCLT